MQLGPAAPVALVLTPQLRRGACGASQPLREPRPSPPPPRRGRGEGGPGRLAPRGDAGVSRAAGYALWKAARARPKSPAGDAGGRARPRPLRAYRPRTPLRWVGFPSRLGGRRALACISFPARCVPSCGGHGEEKPIPGWDSTLKKQYFPPPVAGTCQSGLFLPRPRDFQATFILFLS